MCNEATGSYPHTIEFVLDCYMTQEMCDKIANTQSSTMQFVPECYKTQEMRDKDFNKHFIGFFYIFDQ